MRYLKVTDLRWANKEKTWINCMVTFAQWPTEAQTFTATLTDPETHGRQIYLECVFGLYGEIKEYIEPKRKETWLSGLKKVVLGKLRLPGLG